MPTGRLRLVVTFEEVDLDDIHVYRWLLAWIVHLHASAPARLKMRVEALRDEES